MRLWSQLSTREQHEAIEIAAQSMNVSPAIVEKDLWVVEILDAVFSSADYAESFIFKGGTSLSKAYRAINRFSEDVDLIMDWKLLGYGDADMDPWAVRSRTRQDRFNKEMNARCDEYLASHFAPWLSTELFRRTGKEIAIVAVGDGAVEVRYPAHQPLSYIRDHVLLEIGPLASWIPHGQAAIRSYVAEHVAGLAEDDVTTVKVTTAERTFWEKATILHQQAHLEKAPQARYSRHYYDLYMLNRNGTTETALADMDLLREVAAFKERFYPSRASRYDLATPDTLRLLPEPKKLDQLEDDYRRMRVMMFASPPAWSDIVAALRALERRINSSITGPTKLQ
jgi:hypothetical protein